MPGEICRGLGAACHLQLGEDARHIVLDRLFRKLQVSADLPIRLAVRDLAEDPLLLCRQPRQTLPEQLLACTKAVENAFGYRGIEEVLTGADGTNGPHELTAMALLEDVSGGHRH